MLALISLFCTRTKLCNASIFLHISKTGLKKRDLVGKGGYNETKYLEHLEKIIKSKTTGADLMIDKFSNSENLYNFYDK